MGVSFTQWYLFILHREGEFHLLGGPPRQLSVISHSCSGHCFTISAWALASDEIRLQLVCGSPGKSNCTEPPFPHLQNGDNQSSHLQRSLLGLGLLCPLELAPLSL